MPQPQPKISENDIKTDIGAVISFLQAIDRVIPSKIDQELISFLESVQANAYLLALVTNSFNRPT